MDFLRSLHAYKRLVVPGRADDSGSDGDVRTAVVELDRFLGANLGLGLSYLCSSPRSTPEWVLAFVDGLCDLSIDAAVMRVLEGLLRALCATRRFSLFHQAATQVRAMDPRCGHHHCPRARPDCGPLAGATVHCTSSGECGACSALALCGVSVWSLRNRHPCTASLFSL